MTPEASPEPENEPIKRPDVEERMRAIERVGEEIAKVRAEIEEGRLEAPRKVTDEEREHLEAWAAMTSEERAEWLLGFRKILEEHRDEIAAAAIPELDVDKMIGRLSAKADRVERLARLEEELTELMLQTFADQADCEARLAVGVAETMKYWEDFTEEQWQAITPGDRIKMMDLLNEWNGEQKEAHLAQLPIEIRRRFE
jgi:hypothetical protein